MYLSIGKERRTSFMYYAPKSKNHYSSTLVVLNRIKSDKLGLSENKLGLSEIFISVFFKKLKQKKAK